MNNANDYLKPQITVQAARSLINYVQRRGVDRELMLQEACLSEAELNDNRLLIDVMRFEDMYHMASAELMDTTLGFHHGQQYEVERWGVLSFIAQTSSTLASAMESQFCYQSLSGNMGAPFKEVHGEQSLLQWVPAYNCSHHVSEQIVTGFLSLARFLSNNSEYSPNAVFFTHACVGKKEQYECYFQCSVHFSAEHNALLFDNSMLNFPLYKTDIELNKILLAHAQSLLTEQSFTSPMEVIKDYVIKTLPTHVPDIDEIASCLNLSVRSTQRKLQEYGTSYSQVLDAIRKELALTYLRQTHNSVLYVSERLGFSEQSAFQRAFKRWTGTTPRRYRMSAVAP